VQVLNLFLALLLSSFGTQSLQQSNNGNNDDDGDGGAAGGGGDETPNKLMEAIDRIRRWTAFAKSRCCPLSPSRRTLVSDQPPLLDDLSDLGLSIDTLPSSSVTSQLISAIMSIVSAVSTYEVDV